MDLLKIISNISISTFVLIFTSGISFSWQEQTRVLSSDNIILLASDWEDKNVIYAVSENIVYKTCDGGKSWQKKYHDGKTNKKINRIYIDQNSSKIIYLSTEEGLYQSKNKGDSWVRIFKGNSDLESNCLYMAKSKRIMYLGTQSGLFISNDQGKEWVKSSSQFSDSIISSIVVSPQDDKIVYLACEKGIFITEDDGKNWKRIYVSYGSETPSEDYDDYDTEVSSWVVDIKYMVISPTVLHKIFFLTKNGVFFTENKGERWQEITNSGLLSLNIRSIKISDKDDVFTATDKGIFKKEAEKDYWVKISSELISQDFNDLSISGDGFIWIAGKDGVFKIEFSDKDESIDNDSTKEQGNQKISLDSLFKQEPTIEEVQKAAIDYADVNMDKIKNWKVQARMRALIPSFSVDYDKTITTALGSSYDKVQVGPRDWGMSLGWDLADLIWSGDQTSIDTRSRLTVQLRQDILDQLTHLYFERRKLKVELLLSSPQDEKEKLYKEFEIQEITANIDGLTNGYFSKHLKQHNISR